MQIRVLGCSGSIAAGNRTTSFLVDDDILIDAGTGVGDLTLDELARIDHILVSHSHLDHVLSIGLLADSVARRRGAARRPPIEVMALPATIDALRRHVFNGVIWPDFTRLPDALHPLLRFVPIEVSQVLAFEDRRIEVLPAAHTVPAVGFALSLESLLQTLHSQSGGAKPGPRPEDARYVRAHQEAYRRVLAVRPGITGLSQIRYRSEFEHLVGDDGVGRAQPIETNGSILV